MSAINIDYLHIWYMHQTHLLSYKGKSKQLLQTKQTKHQETPASNWLVIINCFFCMYHVRPAELCTLLVQFQLTNWWCTIYILFWRVFCVKWNMFVPWINQQKQTNDKKKCDAKKVCNKQKKTETKWNQRPTTKQLKNANKQQQQQ